MKTNYALPLAVFAGVLIGIVGGTIPAQQAKTPPGYVIAEVAVTDPATMQKYGEKVPKTLAAFNHHYVILFSQPAAKWQPPIRSPRPSRP